MSPQQPPTCNTHTPPPRPTKRLLHIHPKISPKHSYTHQKTQDTAYALVACFLDSAGSTLRVGLASTPQVGFIQLSLCSLFMSLGNESTWMISSRMASAASIFFCSSAVGARLPSLRQAARILSASKHAEAARVIMLTRSWGSLDTKVFSVRKSRTALGVVIRSDTAALCLSVGGWNSRPRGKVGSCIKKPMPGMGKLAKMPNMASWMS
mmetsp:Transcript_24092/g.46663  ORF Transcript_24092/g.46663 Transcript_24092/m.46663 type:complete len:209 (+) Transcript_24092:267-893(+)